MKNKRVLKKFVALSMTGVILLASSTYTIAATDLNGQKNQNNEQIKNAQKDLTDVQNEKKSTTDQIEEISSQIEQYTNDIQNLTNKLSNLSTSIKESEEKLEKATEDYDKQEKLLEERLVAQYEAGDTSYLDVLVSAESLTDFISNYYLVSELAGYDLELLEKIDNQKKEIENTKTKLENDKKEVETTKQEKDTKNQQLVAAKKEKDAKVASLSEKERDIQAEIDDLKEANKSIDAKIEAANKKKQEQQNNSNNNSNKNNNSSNSNNSNSNSNTNNGGGSNSNSKPSSKGFIKPVSGYPVTTGWYYSDGRLHGAVDFSGSGISGKPIMAAKSGTVIIVEHLKTSYGNYVMIDHNDGTYSLYAHMSSTAAREGQEVSQGQTIGYVGSTGNSSGPHLHFEIRVGSGKYSERVNPLNYI